MSETRQDYESKIRQLTTAASYRAARKVAAFRPASAFRPESRDTGN
jgi:hypothetical protein